MKFIIKRTSMWGEEQPIKEAKKVLVPYWHSRTCSEEYFDKNFSDREGLWRSEGKNHKAVGKNLITRQEEDRNAWVIEIKSLEELLRFKDKYGELILGEYEYSDTEKIYEIEIYDDYRE